MALLGYALVMIVVFFIGGSIGLGYAQKKIKEGITPGWKSVVQILIYPVIATVLSFAIPPSQPIRILVPVACAFFNAGIIIGFHERRSLIIKNTRYESVYLYTFTEGVLGEGIAADRYGQLRFGDDNNGIVVVPFYHNETDAPPFVKGRVRYDKSAWIRDEECAALPMAALFRWHEKNQDVPSSHLVRVKTLTWEWGRVDGQPFIVEGRTGIGRGGPRLICQSMGVVHPDWEPHAEDSLWIMREGDMIHITDTSGRVFVIWTTKKGLMLGEK